MSIIMPIAKSAFFCQFMGIKMTLCQQSIDW